MGRRHRPSLAGWRITRRPAGLPTAQCLRSAIVVNGASRSRSKARARSTSDGGLPAGLVSLPFALHVTAAEGLADLFAASRAQQRLQDNVGLRSRCRRLRTAWAAFRRRRR
ncbi:hypothetical protein DNK60_25025 [Pseudomonas sp. TKO14]|nr:hypothetical protein DNK60_25025 [Pseudomonas sp. TKO14]